MAGSRISLLMVFLLGCAIVNAQQTPMTLGYVKMAFLNPGKSTDYANTRQTKTDIFFMQKVDSSAIPFSPSSISPTYYTQHLGLMCKQELKLEKAIKFPVRIRLGSKDEVDYLEGKFSRH